MGASAETFVLRNGIVVSGKLQSMDAQEIGIERCGRVEHFAREEVKSINLESTRSGEACSASSQPKLELPAGFSITLRTVDHIDSQREPAGQVFRAVLESSIEVDGRILVSAGASMILKLVQAGDSASGQTLDLVAIQLGKRWARIEPAPAKGVSLMATASALATVSVAGATLPGSAQESDKPQAGVSFVAWTISVDSGVCEITNSPNCWDGRGIGCTGTRSMSRRRH